jgi:hypothetical protein
MVEVVEDDIRLNQEEYDVISKIGGVCSTNRPIDLTAATSPRHMRTAAVMLAQLQQQQQQQQASDDPALMQAIRQRVIDQMVTLEEQRMAGLEQRTAKQLFKQGGGSVRPQTVMMNKDDPSGKAGNQTEKGNRLLVLYSNQFDSFCLSSCCAL